MGLLIFRAVDEPTKKVTRIVNSDAILSVAVFEYDNSDAEEIQDHYKYMTKMRIVIRDDAGASSHLLVDASSSSEDCIQQCQEKAKQISALLAGDVNFVDLTSSEPGTYHEEKAADEVPEKKEQPEVQAEPKPEPQQVELDADGKEKQPQAAPRTRTRQATAKPKDGK